LELVLVHSRPRSLDRFLHAFGPDLPGHANTFGLVWRFDPAKIIEDRVDIDEFHLRLPRVEAGDKILYPRDTGKRQLHFFGVKTDHLASSVLKLIRRRKRHIEFLDATRAEIKRSVNIIEGGNAVKSIDTCGIFDVANTRAFGAEFPIRLFGCGHDRQLLFTYQDQQRPRLFDSGEIEEVGCFAISDSVWMFFVSEDERVGIADLFKYLRAACGELGFVEI